MKLRNKLLSSVSKGTIITQVVQYQQDRKQDYIKFINGVENKSFKVIPK